eukprot:scaffold1042_cov401-Prasinococcus_capsulatus_cf.AAC.42
MNQRLYRWKPQAMRCFLLEHQPTSHPAERSIVQELLSGFAPSRRRRPTASPLLLDVEGLPCLLRVGGPVPHL